MSGEIQGPGARNCSTPGEIQDPGAWTAGCRGNPGCAPRTWARCGQGEPSETCMARPSIDKAPRPQPHMATHLRCEPSNPRPLEPSVDGVSRQTHLVRPSVINEPHFRPIWGLILHKSLLLQVSWTQCRQRETLASRPPGPGVDTRDPGVTAPWTQCRHEHTLSSRPPGPGVDTHPPLTVPWTQCRHKRPSPHGPLDPV